MEKKKEEEERLKRKKEEKRVKEEKERKMKEAEETKKFVKLHRCLIHAFVVLSTYEVLLAMFQAQGVLQLQKLFS